MLDLILKNSHDNYVNFFGVFFINNKKTTFNAN